MIEIALTSDAPIGLYVTQRSYSEREYHSVDNVAVYRDRVIALASEHNLTPREDLMRFLESAITISNSRFVDNFSVTTRALYRSPFYCLALGLCTDENAYEDDNTSSWLYKIIDPDNLELIRNLNKRYSIHMGLSLPGYDIKAAIDDDDSYQVNSYVIPDEVPMADLIGYPVRSGPSNKRAVSLVKGSEDDVKFALQFGYEPMKRQIYPGRKFCVEHFGSKYGPEIHKVLLNRDAQ